MNDKLDGRVIPKEGKLLSCIYPRTIKHMHVPSRHSRRAGRTQPHKTLVCRAELYLPQPHTTCNTRLSVCLQLEVLNEVPLCHMMLSLPPSTSLSLSLSLVISVVKDSGV